MTPLLAITGMHRSGTSLLASFLARAGVELGGDFFPADPRNPRGYFEDRDLLYLQTEMLHAAVGGGVGGVGGWPDWGWMPGERLDRSRLAAFRPRAAERAAALAATAGGGRVGGWKDPRTALLLDFWDDLLPELRYVFVYRSPWEVMGSVARLPVAAFAGRPDVGIAAWSFYNRHLLAFHRTHAERCLLLPISALLADPEAVLAAVRAKLGVALPGLGAGAEALAAVLDGELLTPLAGPPALPAVLERLFPAAASLWRELDEAADLRAGIARPEALPPPELATEPPPPTTLTVAFLCGDDGALLPAAVAGVESAVAAAPRLAAEVVAVDGGGADPYSRELIARLPAAGVRVVRPAASGAAAARNAGLAAARGAYVLAVQPGLLRPAGLVVAIGLLEQDPRLGAVGGAPPTAGDGRPPGRIIHLNAADPWEGALLLRRETWRRSGGFDESMAAGYESWDLLLSAAERGWSCRLLPAALCEPLPHEPSALGEPAVSPAGAPGAAETPLQLLPLEHLAAKHPVLVDSRLPRLFNEAEARWLAEVERVLQLTAQASAGRAELAAVRGEAEERSAAVVVLAGELEAARRELERWRSRVEFMEGTSAWRWRSAFLRLRRRLTGGRAG